MLAGSLRIKPLRSRFSKESLRAFSVPRRTTVSAMRFSTVIIRSAEVEPEMVYPWSKSAALAVTVTVSMLSIGKYMLLSSRFTRYMSG